MEAEVFLVDKSLLTDSPSRIRPIHGGNITQETKVRAYTNNLSVHIRNTLQLDVLVLPLGNRQTI